MASENRSLKVIRPFVEMPIAATIGLIGGLLLAFFAPQLVGGALSVYDANFPVLTMSGKITKVEPSSVTLHIVGTKHRGEECKLVNVYGYTISGIGIKKDAIAERIDVPMTGRVRDHGTYDIGLWRVYPVDTDAVSVQVWTHHDCVGRPILSKISDVNLR